MLEFNKRMLNKRFQAVKLPEAYREFRKLELRQLFSNRKEDTKRSKVGVFTSVKSLRKWESRR